MARGDIMAPVERPKTRYGMTPEEAKAHRLLSDPIEFSQNIARELLGGDMDGILIDDTPKQIDELRNEFEWMLDQAIERHDKPAATDAFIQYTEFVTYALHQAQEHGVALGAVMEQLRNGLSGVAGLSRRGLIFGDVQTLKDLQELRRKHDLKPSSQYAKTDLAKAEESEAREQARNQAAAEKGTSK